MVFNQALSLIVGSVAVLLLSWPLPAQPECVEDRNPSKRSIQLVDLAVYLRDSDELDGAIQACTRAIRYDPVNWDAYNVRGLLYRRQRKLALAVQDFETVLRGDPKNAAALANRGLSRADQGAKKEGLEDCEASIRLDPKNAQSYLSRGYVYFLNGRPDDAITDYGTAIRLDPSRILAYQLRATIYQEIGKFDLAWQDFGQAGKLIAAKAAKTARDAKAVSLVKAELDRAYLGGERLREAEHCDEAIKKYTTALEASRTIRPALHIEIARLLDGIGRCYDDLGAYGEAEDLYRESLEIRLALNDASNEGVLIQKENLGQLYMKLGQYRRAQCLFEEVEASLARGINSLSRASNLNNLANASMALGEAPKARVLFEAALKAIEETDADSLDAAHFRNNLAGSYLIEGDVDRAEPLLQKSLAVQRGHPLGKSRITGTLYQLGLAAELRGRPGVAEEHFREALKVATDNRGPTHPMAAFYRRALGGLYAGQGRWEEASREYDAERRITRAHVGGVLVALPEIEQLQFLGEAYRGDFEVALAFAVRFADKPGVAEASAEWVLNGKAVALQTLSERALAAREGREFPAQAGRELAAARERIRLLKAADRQPTEDLVEREKELTRQFQDVFGPYARRNDWVRLDDVRRAIPENAILVEIARFRFTDFQGRKPLAKQQMPPPRYAAWVIPPAGRGDVRVVDLKEGEPTDKLVAELIDLLPQARDRIEHHGRKAAADEAREAIGRVTARILTTLEPHLAGAGHWLISADASLWLVPWAALLLQDGRYVIEGHTVSHLASGRDLVTGEVAPRSKTAVVALHPDFNHVAHAAAGPPQPPTRVRQLTRLVEQLPRPWGELVSPDALARMIVPSVRAYVGGRVDEYLGIAATKDAIRSMPHPQVVVLRTHGFFLGPPVEPGLPPESPLLRCGLVFSGANRIPPAGPGPMDDGILWGGEIVGWDLRGTELVVLDACQTGVGRILDGEGMAGLRQAFQIAGAESVVSTLWPIPAEDFVADLGAAYWTNLRPGADKAEVLRRAQRAVIAAQKAGPGRADHPYYWAGLTHTGVPREVSDRRRVDGGLPPPTRSDD